MTQLYVLRVGAISSSVMGRNTVVKVTGQCLGLILPLTRWWSRGLGAFLCKTGDSSTYLRGFLWAVTDVRCVAIICSSCLHQTSPCLVWPPVLGLRALFGSWLGSLSLLHILLKFAKPGSCVLRQIIKRNVGQGRAEDKGKGLRDNRVIQLVINLLHQWYFDAPISPPWPRESPKCFVEVF